MAFDREASAEALYRVLQAVGRRYDLVHDRVYTEAGVDQRISVFRSPPQTFNAPALILQFPSLVAKHEPTFGVDRIETTILAAAGVTEPEYLDDLLRFATEAVEYDPSLDGEVQSAQVKEWRSWRVLAVGGADLLTAEVALELQM